MSVKKVYLTAEGARVAAYALNNNIAVNFTKFAIGSGENYNPSQSNAMTKEEFIATVTSVTRKGSNYWKVRGAFRNDELTADLTFRELGLYASDPENDGEEVLYCYGNAKGDDFDYTEIIPAFTTSGNVATRILDIDVYVQGDNATYFIDDTAKVDVATVQELREDLEQEIEERTNAIIDVEHGGTGETTQGAINKNIAKIIPLLENDPTDETLFTMRGADDSLSDNASFFTRKAVSVWNYIKNKISSVLGLTATEYSGTSTFAKAPLNARVSISTVDTTKPYGLLAKYSTNITGYENIGFTFLAVLDLASTDINILNNVYLMRIAGRRSKSSLDCLSFNCLYSSTGENPTLTLTYNFTANGTLEMELYGHFASSYRTWKIIPVINSNGDYGILPLSAQKWIYQNISDTGANYCVSSPTVNLTNVVDITNPTSPVMFGKATKATQDGNGKNIADTYATKSEVSSTYATKSEVSKVESDAWGITKDKISSELGLTASQYNGNAKTATTASSCSGNSATATKATQDSEGQQINTTYIKGLSISGKTISYTKGDGKTSTLTTQDTVYTHPTTSGNKHIPSGGATSQILGYSTNGTAKWTGRHDFVYTCTTEDYLTDKFVTLDGFELTKGACVRVLFAKGNSVARPKLNVMGSPIEIVVPNVSTGSVKALTSQYGSATGGAYSWNVNTILELMYNGTYWVVTNNPIVRQSNAAKSYKAYIDGWKEITIAGTDSTVNNLTVNLPISFADTSYFANVESYDSEGRRKILIIKKNTNSIVIARLDYPCTNWSIYIRGY